MQLPELLLPVTESWRPFHEAELKLTLPPSLVDWLPMDVVGLVAYLLHGECDGLLSLSF